jgi:hydroxyethylthiazole kinase-like sugar kinase family protein
MRPALLIFGLLRENMSEILEKLPDNAWNRTGIHTERGEMTLMDVVKHMVRHAETHIAQIITLKKTLTT